MFDVKDYTFGIPEIEAHMHTLTGKRPETVQAQQRLLRKWVTHRQRMHAFTKRRHEDVSAWQLEKVSALVDFVFSTHPFYHQLYKSVGYRRGDIVTWGDYDSLPTITKKDLIDNADMFTKNLDQNNGENIPVISSGSSGQVLTLNLSPTSADNDLLLGLRFNDQMLGRRRRPSEWMYQIYLACPPFTSLDGSFPTFTVSNECPPKVIQQHLSKLKPAILYSIPSALLRLSEVTDDPRKLGIKAISTNSEPSTRAERQKIAERLGAPVFDEYSSTELGLIATECREGTYHIVEDNVRVDVINRDANGTGEIVATNLIDSFMPLIRYRQGDLVQVGDPTNRCECGNCFRSLQSFLGRTDQRLQSQTVGAIASDLVMALYDRTLLTSGAGIEEFQIIQDRADRLKLIYVAKAGETTNFGEIERFVTGIKEIFQDPALVVQVEQMPELPRSKSYKRRLIENRISSPK